MRVSDAHNPHSSDRHVACVIDMSPNSSSHTQLEEVTHSDVEAHVQKDKYFEDSAKSKMKIRHEGDTVPKRHSRSERSTQTEEVDNSQRLLLSDTEEEISILEILCQLYANLKETNTMLMAAEWLLTLLTILLPLIPFLGILWSRFWLAAFNVDWAVCWTLIGLAPLLFNSLRRLKGPDTRVGPSGVWIYIVLVFVLLVVLSSASFWSEAPGIYARMILLFPLFMSGQADACVALSSICHSASP